MEVWAGMDQRLPLAGVAEHARRAERLGYTGLQVPEAVHDGLLAALCALEHTRRLRVATSVIVAFARSPTSVATAAWDLQAVSGGRFVLGLGSQVQANLEGRFGVPWAPPAPRMRDYVGAVRAVWRCWQHGEKLDYTSDHYRLDRMQPFFRPEPLEHPEIPVWLGAVGPALTRVAGEVADGLVVHPTNASPRVLGERTLPALREGAERAGRDPARLALLGGAFVATGASAEAVAAERERIRAYLGFLYSTPAYAGALALHGVPELGAELRRLAREGRWDAMPGRIGDDLLDACAPAAPYAEIAALLRERFDGLCTGLTFPMPEDPADDAAATAAIAALRA